jgi:hypothetical protein
MLADKRYCYPLTITDFIRATSSVAMPWPAHAQSLHLPCSSAPSRPSGYLTRSAPTTAHRSPVAARSSGSRGCRYGGCDWALAWSASNPDSLSRTAVMSACI